MIVLDENIVESQVQLLRAWRIAPRQIGQEVGRQGMKDDEVIPLLHSLRQPTFFPRDLRFYERDAPHANYCLVVLAVGQHEVASFVRRFLRHPNFDTHAKRLSKSLFVTHLGLKVRSLHREEVQMKW
jgi:hypothetical protein